MSPYNIHDDLSGDEPKNADAKHPVPGDNATDPERRQWLAWAFTVPAGWRIGEVTRYGALDVTPMTIEIVPPGDGTPRLVRLEEEQHAGKHSTLRSGLIRDAGLRAEHVTSGKIAGDAYYVLCKLARVVGSSDPLDEVREWVDGYREEAKREHWSLAKPDLYRTLDRIRRYPYSKRKINLWLAAVEREGHEKAGAPPQPPLIDDGKGGQWTSITHLATHIRWGRDQPGTISNGALAGRIVELGGKRWRARAWDTSTRDREHQICTVLVRLPSLVEPEEDERV